MAYLHCYKPYTNQPYPAADDDVITIVLLDWRLWFSIRFCNAYNS